MRSFREGTNSERTIPNSDYTPLAYLTMSIVNILTIRHNIHGTRTVGCRDQHLLGSCYIQNGISRGVFRWQSSNLGSSYHDVIC